MGLRRFLSRTKPDNEKKRQPKLDASNSLTCRCGSEYEIHDITIVMHRVFIQMQCPSCDQLTALRELGGHGLKERI